MMPKQKEWGNYRIDNTVQVLVRRHAVSQPTAVRGGGHDRDLKSRSLYSFFFF